MIGSELTGERPQAVGIGNVEVRVPGQDLDALNGVSPLRRRLKRKPLVEHQGVVVKTLVEGVQGGLAFGRIQRNEDAERTLPVGHIVGPIELRLCEGRRLRFVTAGKEAKRNSAKATNALGA